MLTPNQLSSPVPHLTLIIIDTFLAPYIEETGPDWCEIPALP